MRDELQRIEQIERYLEGNMSAEEKTGFEQEMSGDPQLQNDVKLQQDLMQGIKRQALRTDIQQAHQRFVNGGAGGGNGNFFSSAKFFWSLGGLAVLTVGLLWYFVGRGLAEGENHGSQQPIASKQMQNIGDTFDAAIPSQFFTIKPGEDQVIRAENGTRIYVPKNAFPNQGEPVTLEVKEALEFDDMVMGNLTTVDDEGKLLESDGMLYVSAKQGEDEVKPSPDAPLYIEIPTQKRKKNMQIYKGYRGNNGNMIWMEPKDPENYLATVPFDQLDFYPPGFEDAVAQGLPYRNHKSVSKQLTDSLYYSLRKSESESNAEESAPQGDEDLDINNPYYRNGTVKNGEYTEEAFEQPKAYGDTNNASYNATYSTDCDFINPLSIKTIRQAKYAESYIATKEFEARLEAIHGTCQQSLLEIYTKHLDKPLWQVDEMAAKACQQKDDAAIFRNFAAEKAGNTKDGKQYAVMLRQTYSDDLARFNEELEKAEAAYHKTLRKEADKVEKLKERYRKVIVKREARMMTAYGFEWGENGWMNIDRGTVPKTATKPIEVKLAHTQPVERSYVYFSFPSIKSLYRLNYDAANQLYYPGRAETHSMDMPGSARFIVVAVGYQGENMLLDTLSKPTTFGGELQLEPKPVSDKEGRQMLRQLSGKGRNNSIAKDLRFQKAFYAETLRREKLRKEKRFVGQLKRVAFRCCNQTSPSSPDSFASTLINKREQSQLTREAITVVKPNGEKEMIFKDENPELFEKYKRMQERQNPFKPKTRDPSQDNY